jgi:hypothetical protein
MMAAVLMAQEWGLPILDVGPLLTLALRICANLNLVSAVIKAKLAAARRHVAPSISANDFYTKFQDVG